MTTVSLRQWITSFRWPLVAASMILLYTLAGFLLLPFALKYFITSSLAEQWKHPVQLRDVSFNPYRLYLQLDGFEVQDSDGSQLLALEQLRFDYEALSVFRLEIGVEEFSIEEPFIKLDADGKGSYTLLDMLAGTEPGSAPQPMPTTEEASGDLLPVLLRSVSMRSGTILYRDKARAGGFEQTIAIPSLSIQDFHTRKTALGNHIAVKLSNQLGATLDIDANVRLKPLQAHGNVALKNLNLEPIWQLIMLPVNFQLQAPVLDLSANFNVAMTDVLSLQVEHGELQLTNAVLSSKESPEQAVLSLPKLAASNISVSLPEQRVIVEKFLLADGWIDVVLAKEGSTNLEALFAPASSQSATGASSPMPPPASSAPAPADDPPDKPWDVTIQQLAVENFTVQLKDEHPSEPFVATISPIGIAIEAWKPLSSDPFNIKLHTGISAPLIAKPAELSIDTRLQISPLLAESRVDLRQFPLVYVQPYIHDTAKVDINAGELNAGLDIKFSAAESTALQAKGDVSISALDVHEKGGKKKLLSWNTLSLAGVTYDLAANSLEVSQISIDRLNSGFTINPDGTTNVHDLLVPQQKQEAPSAPMKLQIGKIAITDTDLGFADLTMRPNFHVGMRQLYGSINGLSSDPKSTATIDIKGKVDRYAPVTIKGKMNPLIDKPRLDARMAFKNLELTTFTPYSGTYAGFKIEKGQLSLDIDYKLVNNKIQGKNHIVMDQLQLGDTVESNKAVNLPLRLAIALLRDEKGVIDLGFEVGGDLNDPQFSITGIIWKVLSNMIMKVVTSPFNALSALAGGADTEGMDQIVFMAGQDQPDQQSISRLQTAAAMLQKRSSLQLNVHGNALPDQDRPALQKQKLLAILQENNDVPADAFLSGQAAKENGDAYKLVARYYKQQRNDDIGDIQDRLKEEMKVRGEETDRKSLQYLAYDQAWQRLQDGVQVSDEELRELAMQRARRIKAILVEQHGVAPDRVFVLDANTDPTKASLTTLLTLDAR